MDSQIWCIVRTWNCEIPNEGIVKFVYSYVEFAFVKFGFTTRLFHTLIPIKIIAHLLKPMIHVTFCKIPWCYQCDKIREVMGAQNGLWHSPTLIVERTFMTINMSPFSNPLEDLFNAKNFHANTRVLPLPFGSCWLIKGALRLDVMVVYHVLLRRSRWRYRKLSLSSLASMLDQDCHSDSWPCPQMPHFEKFHANHPWVQQS